MAVYTYCTFVHAVIMAMHECLAKISSTNLYLALVHLLALCCGCDSRALDGIHDTEISLSYTCHFGAENGACAVM